MNTLVLIAGAKRLDVALFSSERDEPVWTERNLGGALLLKGDASLQQILEDLRDRLESVDGVAIRLTFGGDVFDRPVLYDPEVDLALERLAQQAPLHVPVQLRLVRACREAFRETPLVLLFETAFFVHLPARERLYGLEAARAEEMKVRRYGFHGLYHLSACALATRSRLPRKRHSSAHILSVCLAPKPEVAAVIGRRPVMVSSGATPLEGLPGETSCGELDPSVVLALAQKNHWGPETINSVLTRDSGLSGLVGAPTTLPDIFFSNSAPLQMARAVFEYRLLLASGSAVAAMGGLDAIVFSGPYANLGEKIVVPLLRGLTRENGAAEWMICRDSMERIVAEQANPLFSRSGAMAVRSGWTGLT
jgi:acetate kinase